MEALFTRRRITADEFERMSEAGVFGEDNRLELIEGEIVELPPMNGPHLRCVNRLNRIIGRVIGDDMTVSVQNSLRLAHDWVPQPDISVLRGQDEVNTVPRVEEVVLVIEVSDSTLAADRTAKLPRYAAMGIAEAWLVDLNGGRIERHTAPGPERYGIVTPVTRGQSLVSTVLPALVFDVDAVLGKRELEAE